MAIGDMLKDGLFVPPELWHNAGALRLLIGDAEGSRRAFLRSLRECRDGEPHPVETFLDAGGAEPIEYTTAAAPSGMDVDVSAPPRGGFFFIIV
jgi:hypothetical protein